MKNIGEAYTDEDLEQIGDGLVKLLGVVKKLTTQEALIFLENATEIPTKIDLAQSKAIGPCGMFWTMGNKEVKEGLGVLLELTEGLAALKG